MPTGRFWVIFISIWAQMGFYTLILLVAYSRSRMTCTRPRIWMARAGAASRITLPLLMPTLLVVLVLSVIRRAGL
jgi:alpha-1,4-digalacturonate transport system permease protein